MPVKNRLREGAKFLLLCCPMFFSSCALAAEPPGMASLQAKHSALSFKLANNHYARALYIESTDADNRLHSDLYAELNFPLSDFRSLLKDQQHWCDVLLLNIYSKSCRTYTSPIGDSRVAVNVGSKEFQELDKTYSLDFEYKTAENAETYFDVLLFADNGPLGTSNYAMRLQGLALNGNTSFVHLSYSYSYSMWANLAMQTYLTTLGRGKVGFTELGNATEPSYINGSRGVLERNTMRYFLALDAYLASQSLAPADPFESRLAHWFAATQAYPRQLNDLDLSSYLSIKRREYRRMINLNR